MWRTEGREVKDAISSEESQVGIVKTKANRGEKPAPWSSLLSVPAGTTARCSWWPQPPYEAQTWHAGISSMLLAGGREAASFTGAFLLSAPCHHSTQLDLQISWFLDVALHHWWPILFCFLIFVTFYLWASETKFRQWHWVDEYSPASGLRVLERTRIQKVSLVGPQIWGRSR